MVQVSEGRRRQLLKQSEPLKSSRGARLGSDTLTYVSAHDRIRPLRDQLIIEPLDVVYSRHLYVYRSTKPLRGIVKACGPGTYEIGYRDEWGRKTNDRTGPRRRTQRYHTNNWIPMSLKVGDVVELGGAEREGIPFETFYWGDKLHLHCTERDIAGVVDE